MCIKRVVRWLHTNMKYHINNDRYEEQTKKLSIVMLLPTEYKM